MVHGRVPFPTRWVSIGLRNHYQNGNSCHLQPAAVSDQIVTSTRREKGPFSDELLDQLLCHLKGQDAESLLGQAGLVGQLKKQLMERMLAGELTQHLRSEA